MTIKPLALLLIPGLLLLALSPLAPAAHGTTPTEGSGTLQALDLTPLDQRLAGPNVFFSEANTFTITGTLLGTFDCQVGGMVRPTGEGTADITCTFTGTVQGHSGTSVLRANETFAGDSAHGRFVLAEGTGDLANLHGHGTFTLNFVTGAGTYSGQFHFDPD